MDVGSGLSKKIKDGLSNELNYSRYIQASGGAQGLHHATPSLPK